MAVVVVKPSAPPPQQALAERASGPAFGVPFTSPELAGARVRPTDRGRMEVLLPNFAGTRGIRLQNWSVLRDACVLSLHDLRLAQYLECRMPECSPAAIRAAGHAVAAEGFLGEAVAKLERAGDVGERNRLARRLILLRRLAAGCGAHECATSPCPSPLGGPAAVRWETAAINHIAMRNGLAHTLLAHATDALSGLLPAVGGTFTARSRPARMASALRSCRSDWRERQARITDLLGIDDATRLPTPAGAAHPAPRVPPLQNAEARRLRHDNALYERLGVRADRALKVAERHLALLDEACRDVNDLIVRWSNDPGWIAKLVLPLDLALDGWERVCSLWEASDGSLDHRGQMAAELSRIVDLSAVHDDATSGAPVSQLTLADIAHCSHDENWKARLHSHERARIAELVFDLVDEGVASAAVGANRLAIAAPA